MKNFSSYLILIVALLFCRQTIVSQNCTNRELVINQNFSKYNGQNRLYNLTMLRNDFPRVSARTSGEIRGIGPIWPQKNRVINGELRAEFLRNAASGRSGGFLFDSSFGDTDEAILEYRVKFDRNFNWAAGGKLPGLGGSSLTRSGAIPSGCTTNPENINNGFSSRLMWRTNLANTVPPRLVVYNYFPDRTNRCGEDIEIIRNISKDRWYTIRQYIKLNTPGRRNGIMRVWVDGNLRVDQNNIRYRLAGKNNVRINALVMNTYRGGNASEPAWWSPTTDYIYFDDFKVWRNCSDTGVVQNDIVRLVNDEFNKYIQCTATPDRTPGEGINVRAVNTNMNGTWTQWRLIPAGQEYFRIENVEHGLWLQCTDILDATNGQPASDQLDPSWSVRAVSKANTGDWTRWRKISAGNGYFRLENKGSGKWLQITPLTDRDTGGSDGGLQLRAVNTNKTGTWTQWREGNTNRISKVLHDEDGSIITLYPNPVTSHLTIKGVQSDAIIQIYTMNGEKLGHYYGNSIIDVDHIPQGVYFVKTENQTVKFIKK